MPTDDDKKKKSPATTSLAYDAMIPRWAKMGSLMGGTDAMRAAGEEFLPRHTDESDGSYNERLARSTLFNVTKLTLNDLVGRPFSERINKNEDLHSKIEPLLEDIDLLGNNIDVFARNWFQTGFLKAFSHVLVDQPRARPREDGAPRTVADDEAQGIRPFWIHIPPENLIFARANIIDGKEVLEEIRILETITEQEGFAEIVTVQIRRLVRQVVEGEIKPQKKVMVEIYQPDPNSKRPDDPEWILIDSFPFGLSFIPFVTFYADREDFMLGIPPLNDLADLNIQHWQSTSDQINILTVSRFPILALSGSPPDGQKKIEIGPRKWLHTTDSQGKYYYVEHQGKAIEAGEKDLQHIEDRMANFGSQFLKKRPGGMTATARALDSAEATSPLQDAVIRFNDALNLAIQFTGVWMNIVDSQAGTVSVLQDFGPEEVNASDFTALKGARDSRDISRKAYLEELKLRGTLNEDYDPDEDFELIQKEMMNLSVDANEDLDPGNNLDTEDDNNIDTEDDDTTVNR